MKSVNDAITKTIPELKDVDIQVQTAKRVPAKSDPIPYSNQISYAIEITYKGASLRFTTDLSEEILQAQRQWSEIVKKLNKMNVSPRIQ